MTEFRDLPDGLLRHDQRPDGLHDDCDCGQAPERTDPWKGKGVFTRRRVIQGSTAFAAALGVQQVTTRFAFSAPAAGAAPARTIGIISLRGGLDGLSWLEAPGDPNFYKIRGSVADPQGQLLQLSSMFGLNPNLKPLQKWWDKGNAAFIPAMGTQDKTLSHFESTKIVEGGAEQGYASDGYLARALRSMGGLPVLAATSIGNRPISMDGGPAIAMNDIASFGLGGLDSIRADETKALKALYSQYTHPMAKTALETLGAIDTMTKLQKQQYKSVAQFPNGGFADGLKTAARLVNANVGMRMFTVEVGGFDTHTNQKGQLDNHAQEFSGALDAFLTEIGANLPRVTLFVISEFGRTIRINGNGGSDHGRGQLGMAFGGGVTKGLFGAWPGMTSSANGYDNTLMGTVDYRSAATELLRWGGVTNPAAVFPGFTPKPVGMIKG